MVCLEKVLSDAHVDAFVQVLGNEALFEGGDRTAGGTARRHKRNLQAASDRPEVRRIISEAREALNRHSLFQRFAVPQRLGRMLISRYEPGMTYGAHFDEAFIDGLRTDLSFTLFLSDADSYAGGELELHSPMGTQAIKLPAGCALVYPSDQLHAVRPVESGVRLAIIGWVQSRVRGLEQRQLLFELAEATKLVQDESGAQEGLATALRQLKLVRNNLLRMWAQ